MSTGVARCALCLAATLLVVWVVHFLGRRAARSVQTALHEQLLRIVDLPLLFLGLAFTTWQTVIAPAWWDTSTSGVGWLFRLLTSVAVLTLLWRILREIVTYAATGRAQNSASDADDVIVPVLTRQVLPIIVAFLGVLAAFWAFDGSIATGITTIGALSFLLVYVLHDPMSNLFSGLALALDVPFRYGDLITLEDGKTYAVRRIGSRVTQLYDISQHNSVYIPNSALTQQRLINLVLPNAELRQQIVIGVAYETAYFDRVRELMCLAAQSHPHVLGRLEEKLSAMEQRLKARANGGVADVRSRLEQERLRAEHRVRAASERFLRRIRTAADLFGCRSVPEASSPTDETIEAALAAARQDFHVLQSEIAAWVFWLGFMQLLYRTPNVETISDVDDVCGAAARFMRDEQTTQGPQAEPQHVRPILGCAPIDRELPVARQHFADLLQKCSNRPESEIVVGTWLDAFATWEAYVSFERLYASWHKPMYDAGNALAAAERCWRGRGRRRREICEGLDKLGVDIEARLPLGIGYRRCPDVGLTRLGDFAVEFTVDFYVDNVVSDYYEREGDVRDEVLADIFDLLSANDIEIPYPRMDITASKFP